MSADAGSSDEYDWVDVENISATVFTEPPTLSVYRDGSGNINKSADYQWFADHDGFVRRADPDAHVLGFIPTDGEDVRQINREGEFGGTVGLQKALTILGIDAGELDETYFTDLERHGDVIVADLSDLAGTAADTRTDSDRALDATTAADDEPEEDDSDESATTARCESCDYVFDDQDALDRHRAETHGDVDEEDTDAEDETDEEESKDEYQCRHCPDAFDSLQGRKIHEGRVHKGEDDEDDEEEADDGLTPDDVELPGSLTEGDVHAVADVLDSLDDVAADLEVSEERTEKILEAYDLLDEVDR